MIKWIWLLVFLFSSIGCNPSVEFIVPKDFEGVVVVIFNDPKGVKADHTYPIPPSGFLFVRDPSPEAYSIEVYSEEKGEKLRSNREITGKKEPVGIVGSYQRVFQSMRVFIVAFPSSAL